MITKGKKVDDFTLADKDGLMHTLYDIQTKYTIVYFYPKDNTPGCTIEAKMFSDTLSEFKKFGVTVLGISGGDEKSKTKFCEKNELKLILLSDTDFAVATSLECYGDNRFMGKSFKSIFRNTYLLDKNKTVLRSYEKVKPLSHVKELLSDIRKLEGK
tara:strand:+ start:464 stop:934 length:471 start_codon:yes stop_codon:yes gene_type:complete